MDLFVHITLDIRFQEKAPFVEKAEKRKSDYNKNMQDYNKQLVIFFGIIVVYNDNSDDRMIIY